MGGTDNFNAAFDELTATEKIDPLNGGLLDLIESLESKKSDMINSLSLDDSATTFNASGLDDVFPLVKEVLSAKRESIEALLKYFDKEGVLTFNAYGLDGVSGEEMIMAISSVYTSVIKNKVEKMMLVYRKDNKLGDPKFNVTSKNNVIDVVFVDEELQKLYLDSISNGSANSEVVVTKEVVSNVEVTDGTKKKTDATDESEKPSVKDDEKPSTAAEKPDTRTPEQKLQDIKTSGIGRVLSFFNYTDADFKNILNGTNILGIALFGILGSNKVAGGHFNGIINMLPRKWRITVREVQDKVMRTVGLRAKLITESEFEDLIVKGGDKDADFGLKKAFDAGNEGIKITLGEESKMVIPKGKNVTVISVNGETQSNTSFGHNSEIIGAKEPRTYIFTGKIPAKTEFEGDVKFELMKKTT